MRNLLRNPTALMFGLAMLAIIGLMLGFHADAGAYGGLVLAGYVLPLTNLQNIGTNNTSTLKLPVGKGAPTLDALRFELGGTATAAHIDWIRIKGGGRIFFEESGGASLVNKHDLYRGMPADTTYFVVDFTEPKARNGAAEQLVAAIPLQLFTDVTVEIKHGASWPVGGTLKVYMVYRPPTVNQWIRKQLVTTAAFTAAGTDGAPQIVYLPTGGNGGKIKRIKIEELTTAGGITGAVIRIANNVVHETTRANEESEQKRLLLVPQTGIFYLDFVKDGNLAGMLDTGTAPNTELRLVGVANNYRISYEFIDPISRL